MRNRCFAEAQNKKIKYPRAKKQRITLLEIQRTPAIIQRGNKKYVEAGFPRKKKIGLRNTTQSGPQNKNTPIRN